jgi:IS1 family transposase
MNKLPVARRVAILKSLTEGCSLRATARIVGVSINTVVKMLIDAGKACAEYQHEVMRNLPCQRLQLDEIWGFIYAKDKNVPKEMAGQVGVGSIWTWIAIDADTKLIPTWLVGLRDGDYAREFVADLSKRLANRVQVTTDGLKVYLEAMEAGFGGAVDYAQLIKVYGPSPDGEHRYSPAECIESQARGITGNPQAADISTSYVERQNLQVRMRNRRFTRLTNAFSKKLENLEHSVALHFFVYNFITRHGTLRMPPALKAGVADHWWTFEDLVKLIDRPEQPEPRTSRLGGAINMADLSPRPENRN